MEPSALSEEAVNEMASQLLDWRKASLCQGNGDCVEVAAAPGWVAVRDSKNRDAQMLTYSPSAWRSFVEATKLGKLDLL